jgi:hypothetical protein
MKIFGSASRKVRHAGEIQEGYLVSGAVCSMNPDYLRTYFDTASIQAGGRAQTHESNLSISRIRNMAENCPVLKDLLKNI